jgi:Type IV secretory pathway, VirB4 components
MDLYVFVPAAAGVLLLFAALLIVRDHFYLNKQISLKRLRPKGMGFCDLLLYDRMVSESTVLLKNGSLLTAWIYEGADSESSTNREKESVSTYANQYFRGLDGGYMVHIDVARMEAPGYSKREESYFPDIISAAMDEERRATLNSKGVQYENVFILWLNYFPPVVLEKKFVDLMYDDDAKPQTEKEVTKNILANFERDCKNFQSNLSLAFKMRRMGSYEAMTEEGKTVRYNEVLSWLQYCITSEFHPMVLPKTPIMLDSIIGWQDFWHGVISKIGEKYIMVVGVGGMPSNTSPEILNILTQLPLEYRWNSRFKFMNQHDAIAAMTKLRSKWKQKTRGFFDQIFGLNGPIDQDAAAMVVDAEDAVAELNSGMVAMGRYTNVILLMHKDRKLLEETAQKVEKAVNGVGFAARIEKLNTTAAYFGSLPGDGVSNCRRDLVNTMNLADLMPTSTVWTGEVKAPCPLYPPGAPALMQCVTSTHAPFRFNIHVRDVGHTLMFGPSGSGKSVALATLVAQLRRYKDMTIFVFDKGMSMYPMCKAMGGSHFEIGSDDSSMRLSPLKYLDTPADLAWAADWLETLCRLNGREVLPRDRNAIGEALQTMQSNEYISRSISGFLPAFRGDLADTLAQYQEGKTYGHYFDYDDDGLEFSNFTVFEIEELMQAGGGSSDRVSLPTLLYLFRRIERQLRGQPAVIVLDEAWVMLGHPVFREKIREWMKVLRKANCSVIMATQSLSDAERSGILDVLVEQSATKIFLPNLYAREEIAANMYMTMGLNERQIDILAESRPKQHYYYVSEQGRRLFELALGPLQLAFVGASDKDSIQVIKELEAEYGEKWPEKWLEYKGVNYHRFFEDAMVIRN